jgi:predicted ester cyclase
MTLTDWFNEVWNAGNEDAIDRFLAPDVIIHNLPQTDGEPIESIPAFKKMFRTFRSTLSEIHVTVDLEINDADTCVAHCIITAIHSGDGLGVAPRGNPIKFTGLSMARIRDGKFVECWNEFDFASMYQQME